jgi:hypothetical protein
MTDSFVAATNDTSAHDYGVLLSRYGFRLTDTLPLAASRISTSTDGSFTYGGALAAILVPVWVDGSLLDVVAFSLDRPSVMWRERCRAPRLFGDGLEPVAVWPTADQWLLRRCAGQVLLDRRAAWDLYGGAKLQVEDPDFARQLDRWCKPPKFRDANITVQPYRWPAGVAA